MIVTTKSTSAYVHTVLKISYRDHMCLLSVNAMILRLTFFFEIRIMPERLYLIKNDYAGCSLPYLTKHTTEV